MTTPAVSVPVFLTSSGRFGFPKSSLNPIAGVAVRGTRKTLLLLAVALLLAGCTAPDDYQSPKAHLVYKDDEAAGVRCYKWSSASPGVSCVQIR